MKKVISSTLALIMALLLTLTLCACSGKTETPTENQTENAATAENEETAADAQAVGETPLYDTSTELGEGEKTFTLTVATGAGELDFTVHTDKETVGEALEEVGLIEGEEGAYGLYVKKVNGITADYDTTGEYWAFYEGGEYATAGVDKTVAEDGATYCLAIEK